MNRPLFDFVAIDNYAEKCRHDPLRSLVLAPLRALWIRDPFRVHAIESADAGRIAGAEFLMGQR